MSFRHCIYWILWGCLWGFTACSSSPNGGRHRSNTAPLQKVIIKDKKGNRIVRFAWNEQKIWVKTPRLQWQHQDSVALLAKTTKTYFSSEQTPLVQTRAQGLNISAKLPQKATPAWRLRFAGDTMQVIQASQPKPSYWAVQYKLNKYRVYNQAGNEVGKTKITNGIVDVDGFGIDLKIPTHANSYAYALLMMYQIPEEIRFSLMAELLLRQL